MFRPIDEQFLNFAYLIQHLHRKSLSTLSTLVRFLSIMEAFVVLFQIADPGEALVALIAPEIATTTVAALGITGFFWKWRRRRNWSIAIVMLQHGLHLVKATLTVSTQTVTIGLVIRV